MSDLTAADIMAAHKLSRAATYEHMRRAVGREDGARGALRVDSVVWAQYWEDYRRCGCTNEGESIGSRTATSLLRRESSCKARRSRQATAQALAVTVRKRSHQRHHISDNRCCLLLNVGNKRSRFIRNVWHNIAANSLRISHHRGHEIADVRHGLGS